MFLPFAISTAAQILLYDDVAFLITKFIFYTFLGILMF